jgi:hypothetical protein
MNRLLRNEPRNVEQQNPQNGDESQPVDFRNQPSGRSRPGEPIQQPRLPR